MPVDVEAAGVRRAVLAAGARVVADGLAELEDIDEGVAPRLSNLVPAR